MALFTSSSTDTIIALATPEGRGAIAVIRLSGKEAIEKVSLFFKGKDLRIQPSHTLHVGTLRNEENGVVDEVVVSLFKAPHSFTKEDVVEISCHGSPFIIKKIIELFLSNGVRYAEAGEFTKRAFMNGRFDLAQAEAVADLIASDSEAAHKTALHQMRGGFSQEIRALRSKLIDFVSLIELELDFSEEDVEFANRSELQHLLLKLFHTIQKLIESFTLGNVIKNGVPVVIAGKPNAGKSTLLNALLNEEKAIVSEIAGTTRDFIEDELSIEGVSFRFIDTAGLRQTTDKIEAIGVERTRAKMKQASLIILLYDAATTHIEGLREEKEELQKLHIPFLTVGNKIDQVSESHLQNLHSETDIFISAEKKEQLEILKKQLLSLSKADSFSQEATIVTNVRHWQSLQNAQKSIQDVLQGLDMGLTTDLLALELRNALHHLGEITGEVTNDEILGNVFSKFCIGK